MSDRPVKQWRDPMRSGQAITVTYEGVSADATYRCSVGNDWHFVELAGTGQLVTVPGEVLQPR